MNKVYRVYLNGDIIPLSITDEHLPGAIKYNAEYRPGTAYIVNGVCVQTGYLTKQRALELVKNYENEKI